ncbi:MAG: hypothetical protein RRZ85_02325 [Gordonibacter sp.]|uniref:hypothetical protein n=2 Tax=Gordonibacter sp. TaxID=1968902 RepID=UPI002FC6A38F
MMVKKKTGLPKKAIVAVCLSAVLVLMVAGCGAAPKSGADNPDKGQKQEDSVAVAWSMDSDCGMCHAQQKESQAKTGTQACIHATSAKATCGSCHNDAAALGKVHEGKTATDKMPSKLTKSTVSRASCQAAGCHTAEGPEFEALTASVETFVDGAGKMVNPHQVIAQVGHEEMVCASCHNEHDGKPVADMAYCATCHHSGTFAPCVSCHG